MKQSKKQKEAFNGILNASVRTKMPSSDKVMSHDQKHWLKTPIFTHICNSLRLQLFVFFIMGTVIKQSHMLRFMKTLHTYKINETHLYACTFTLKPKHKLEIRIIMVHSAMSVHKGLIFKTSLNMSFAITSSFCL